MNKNELNSSLSAFVDNPTQFVAEIYFILKEENRIVLKFANIEENAQLALKRQYFEAIKDDIVGNSDISVMNISESDGRADVIYKYDFDNIPEELNIIEDVITLHEDIEDFTFTKDEFDKMQGILVNLSNEDNKLILYKKHYPIGLYRKDSCISIFKKSSENMFVQLDENILKINSTFDFFQLNGELFIRNLKVLEKFFGFNNIIEKLANDCISKIESNDIIENSEKLKEMVKNPSFARKLTKVLSNSPVLEIISKSDILEFAKSHPLLGSRLKIVEEKFILTFKTSCEAFVKLLNDDYLKSGLTDKEYDSLAKDKIDVQEASRNVD